MTFRERALAKLRKQCLSLPETNEVVTWGHPTFRAGKKAFAVLEDYEGTPSLALRIGLDRQEQLLTDHRFFETPYAARFGWVSLRLDSATDWDEVENLVGDAYRTVALQRMLKALDGHA